MIRILTTGGTIDKVYFDARSEYEVGEPQVTHILREAGVTVPFSCTVLLRKDSLELDDEDRALIARTLAEVPEKHVLITHGTDTMVETALALGDARGKTVVLVGSLSPALHRSTDADFNVGFAFAAVQTLPPGVWIAMNGHVFDPRHVRKNRVENRFEPTRQPRSDSLPSGSSTF